MGLSRGRNILKNKDLISQPDLERSHHARIFSCPDHRNAVSAGLQKTSIRQLQLIIMLLLTCSLRPEKLIISPRFWGRDTVLTSARELALKYCCWFTKHWMVLDPNLSLTSLFITNRSGHLAQVCCQSRKTEKKTQSGSCQVLSSTNLPLQPSAFYFSTISCTVTLTVIILFSTCYLKRK